MALPMLFTSGLSIKDMIRAGASNLFQPLAKFAVPKVWWAKIYSLSFYLPKNRWRPKKKGLRSDLIGVQKKGFCGIFLQLTTSARKHQSTNQRQNLWWAISKPLAGHCWPAGRGSDALGLEILLCRVWGNISLERLRQEGWDQWQSNLIRLL